MLIDRIHAILLCVLLVLAPLAANASQNALVSPTTGTVSGLQLTNNYNNALDSLNTGNSGATAPSNQLTGTPSLGNIWINSTSGPFPWQVHDGVGWRTPFWIDAVNGMTNVKIGGGAGSIASAGTVDLCGSAAAPLAYLTITGSTAITSFGSTCKQGHIKIVTFSGALTLTYNATSMIIPGAANVLTSAGDQAVMVSLGSGSWQVVAYTPVSGSALVNPAVDLGTYLMTSLTAPPSSKYLFAYGQAISRTTYATLMTGQTITQSVTRTNGSPTLTGFSDTTQIPVGAAVEGSGIATSDTISSCTSTTCTMAANATSSGTASVTIFPNGNGDGSTTFNLPNCQGVALAGRDNMSGTPRGVLSSTYYGTNPDALGAFGGAQNRTIAVSNFPAGNLAVTLNWNSFPTYSNGNTGVTGPGSVITTSSSNGIQNFSNMVGSASAALGGSGTPLATVQPTLTANCMIRVLAMIGGPRHQLHALASDDNDLSIADRRRAA